MRFEAPSERISARSPQVDAESWRVEARCAGFGARFEELGVRCPRVDAHNRTRKADRSDPPSSGHERTPVHGGETGATDLHATGVSAPVDARVRRTVDGSPTPPERSSFRPAVRKRGMQLVHLLQRDSLTTRCEREMAGLYRAKAAARPMQ